MSARTTRRAVLAGAAALPALSVAGFVAEADPIFAAIEKHKTLQTEFYRLHSELDEAERRISERRPIALVSWRNYDIGGSEIEQQRERLLRVGRLKPRTIEREYLRAKEEYRKREEAAVDWDKKHGLHEKGTHYYNLMDEMDDAADALARTIPMSVAGAVTLLEYVLADGELRINEPLDWHIAALENVAKCLREVRA